MSKPLKPRRGTTAEQNAFVGEAYEVTYDTDKNTLVCRDGLTAGGFPLAKEADLDTIKAAQSSRDAEQDAAISAVQSSADDKLPLDGNKSWTIRGTTTSYTFAVNNTATALQITARDSNEVIRAALFLNGSTGRITARVFNESGESEDFYLSPDSWKAVWAGKNIVRSVNGEVADALGNVAISIPAPPVTSVNGKTGAVTISSVTTATKATTCPNVYAWENKNVATLPSGGTWAYLAVHKNGTPYAATAAGGSNVGSSGSGIAIRTT